MAKNKSGKTELMTVIVWVVIIGAIAAFFNFGGFGDTVKNWMPKSSAAPSNNVGVNMGTGIPTETKDCPTSGLTSLTVNLQDALTTTATNIDGEYYLFNGNQLIKEGSVPAGTQTFDVSCGKDYKLLLINSTTKTGAYGKIVDVSARYAAQTINEKLVVYGNGKIYGIQNPSDPSRNANISLVASATKSFEIKFGANKTQTGYNKPLILCTVNVTSIQTINLDRFDDGSKPVAASQPKRITSNAGYTYYVWEYPKMLDPTVGTLTAVGSITATSSTPALENTMACKLADQAMWKTASYKTSTSIDDGFKTGAENTETQSDVGAPDSAEASLYFSNGDGY